MDNELIELVASEIEAELEKHPEGRTRGQLAVNLSTDENVVIACAMNRLGTEKKVVNLSGTPIGPYVLTKYYQGNLVRPAGSRLQRPETLVAPAPKPKTKAPLPTILEDIPDEDDPLLDDSVDAPEESDEEEKPRETVDQPASMAKSLPNTPQPGVTRPNTMNGLVAYAFFKVHQSHPNTFATLGMALKRMSKEFFGIDEVMSLATLPHPAVRALVATGILERGMGYGEYRWNASKWRYPFPVPNKAPDLRYKGIHIYSKDSVPSIPTTAKAVKPAAPKPTPNPKVTPPKAERRTQAQKILMGIRAQMAVLAKQLEELDAEINGTGTPTAISL